MAYKDTLVELAEETVKLVLAAFRSFLEGLLTREEAVTVMAYYIAEGNGRARMLSDLHIAADLMDQLGTEVPVSRVTIRDDRDRLEKAAATVLTVAEKSDVPEKIVARLARSEPLEAAADAATEAMVRSGKTKGWTRQLSSEACQLCRWWWREGRIWPAEHPFQHHKGCTCTPKPVVADDIRETRYTRQLKGMA